jgi:hypothetical protein
VWPCGVGVGVWCLSRVREDGSVGDDSGGRGREPAAEEEGGGVGAAEDEVARGGGVAGAPWEETGAGWEQAGETAAGRD